MKKASNYIRHRVFPLLALVGLLIGFPLLPQPPERILAQVSDANRNNTFNLNTARFHHTATLLPDGKVLVTGGLTNKGGNAKEVVNSAEYYDPSNRSWSYTGSLITERDGHTATLLPDGKVLVAGGWQGQPNPPVTLRALNSAELYDSTTGKWSSTGNLINPRGGHTATLLFNGKVLVTGGSDQDGILNSAELYDPVTGTWSNAGTLLHPRGAHTATLLLSGKVLVAGGVKDLTALNSVELYDPLTGTWNSTGSLNTKRAWHTATLLPNGNLLVADGDGHFDNSAELYDPFEGTWRNVGNLNLFHVEAIPTATLLPNGQVFMAGFFNYDEGYLGSTRLYDPATRLWSDAENVKVGYSQQTATLLHDGRVLLAGGEYYAHALSLTECLDPALFQASPISNVSAASYSLMRLASEAIASVFGTKLSVTTSAAHALPLPTQLAGTTIKVKDSAGFERLAPLFFASPTQINYQIPPGTAPGAATVTIASGDGTTFTGVAVIHTVAPSLFSANGNGQGLAAATALRVKADGSQQFEPLAQFDTSQNKFISRPLDLGPETDRVYLVLFGTGIRGRSSLSSVITTIGGTYAEVSYAGAQPDLVGVDQINVLVPRSLVGRGEVDVMLTVEAQMANPVRIHIR